MNLRYGLFIFSLFIVAHSFAQVTSFDDDWRFHRGGALGAESPDFDDSKWVTTDLPHDWSILDLPGTQSPFDPLAVSQVGGGFTVGGTGWYRKSFTISPADKNRKIIIQFDGVYMNADIWLNGENIGNHPYGYTPFWFEVSGKIKYGEKNTIAVQVKNEGQNSRWYSGSGIYRHVWLKMTGPLHIAQWGVAVTTTRVNASSASIVVHTKVLNEDSLTKSVRFVTHIINASGKEIAVTEAKQTIAPGSAHEFNQPMDIANAQRWSVDSPFLYKVISEIYTDEKKLNEETTTFGIRTISFDAVNGFMLNGKSMKLKGGCVHHDNGPLGARAYDRAEERRIELLKASGFNAIRCAHNPASTAFLDACDRLGMLVIDEAFDMWHLGNNPYDYHLYFDEWWQRDIETMVLRDRNHPSVILWSIGNEIREMESPEVIEVASKLANYVRKMDPTRPVTAAVNGIRPQKDPFFATLDVCGYNYADAGVYAAEHQRMPGRVIFGSESYAKESFNSWMGVLDNPSVTGDFVWTAFDYIGEASIGWRGYWQEANFYPWNLAYCGDIDICGWRRPQSFYREALWKENKIALFVKAPKPTFPLNPAKQSWSKWDWPDVLADWSWPGLDNQPMEISVYSSCEQAELFLNGRSLGRKKTDRSNQFIATWNVPYRSGELKAVGYKGKKIVATSLLQTAEKPQVLKLSSDRNSLHADGQDLSYITVELADASGNRNPKAENFIKFEISGPGTIVGVGNANPMSTESYQLPQRKAWQGRCLVIVKSSKEAGNITLTATTDGLPPAKITIISGNH